MSQHSLHPKPCLYSHDRHLHHHLHQPQRLTSARRHPPRPVTLHRSASATKRALVELVNQQLPHTVRRVNSGRVREYTHTEKQRLLEGWAQGDEWTRWGLEWMHNMDHQKRKRWRRTLQKIAALPAEQRPAMCMRRINGQHWTTTHTLEVEQRIFDAAVFAVWWWFMLDRPLFTRIVRLTAQPNSKEWDTCWLMYALYARRLSSLWGVPEASVSGRKRKPAESKEEHDRRLEGYAPRGDGTEEERAVRRNAGVRK